MGCGQSQLTEQDLQDYKDLTFLTRQEILHTFHRFKEIKPNIIKRDKMARLPISLIQEIPELQNNPFADRLCYVFASDQDDCMSFEDFLDMVSVLSQSAPLDIKVEYAFNIYVDIGSYGSASDSHLLQNSNFGRRLEAKQVHIPEDRQLPNDEGSPMPWAMKHLLYFDDDGMLSPDDVEELVNRLTGRNKLNEEEMNILIEKIMEEADLDKDGYLSLAEFEHMVKKSPEFMNSFQIRF